MSRRGIRLSVRCTEPDCTEHAFFEYDNQRQELAAREARNRYKCVRHSAKHEVLSALNLTTKVELVSQEKPYGRFWNGSNGFAHGPGFRAFADDFPTGTKIVVTAELILPKDGAQ